MCLISYSLIIAAIINLAAAKIEAKYGIEVFQQIIYLPISTFEKQQAQFTQLGQSLNSIRTMVISKLLGVITDVFALVILHLFFCFIVQYSSNCCCVLFI